MVIHPQSVVHSAVRFIDGSLKAQLGTPICASPIQYAMTYPDRRPSPAAPPDLIATARLDFRAPDEDRFPALRIAREAGIAGPRASAASDRRRRRRGDLPRGILDFLGIPRVLEAAVERFGPAPAGAIRTSTSWSPRRRGPRGSSGPWEARRDRRPQVVVTIVLFFAILGLVVIKLGHFITAPGAGARPRVRHRFPAAGQDPEVQGRDALHT